MLARKLYDAPFPTISAVGHEGDYTICDFVCSFRAPTPTGAAMRLTKDKKDVLSVLFYCSLTWIETLSNNLLLNCTCLSLSIELYSLVISNASLIAICLSTFSHFIS